HPAPADSWPRRAGRRRVANLGPVVLPNRADRAHYHGGAHSASAALPCPSAAGGHGVVVVVAAARLGHGPGSWRVGHFPGSVPPGSGAALLDELYAYRGRAVRHVDVWSRADGRLQPIPWQSALSARPGMDHENRLLARRRHRRVAAIPALGFNQLRRD